VETAVVNVVCVGLTYVRVRGNKWTVELVERPGDQTLTHVQTEPVPIAVTCAT